MKKITKAISILLVIVFVLGYSAIAFAEPPGDIPRPEAPPSDLPRTGCTCW